jgi:hypothetical protein
MSDDSNPTPFRPSTPYPREYIGERRDAEVRRQDGPKTATAVAQDIIQGVYTVVEKSVRASTLSTWLM